ncbi:MAG: TRAP transporter small permease, partial [Burkholderiaceae bacterium]
GVAFAIFAFLPWCQMVKGHATVDLFTSYLPSRVQRFLVLIWECLLSGVIVLLTWRLIVGTMDKVANGETTFLLQFPVWWAFAACSIVAVVASVVALYVAAVRIKEFWVNADLLERELEPGH